MPYAFVCHGREKINFLLNLLSICNIAFYHTDSVHVYDIIPENKHIVSKLHTQCI
ncbi:hypothetical protein [Candidatus Enterovibrio escicola]|uniref:hypothetical protein n=1 Tax=Candidatus Enterovibrio escicola TaxID=1927127 RepID=UPI001CC228CA